MGLGISFMVLGLLAIVLPFVTARAAVIVVGWLLILAGVSEGWHAVENRRWAGAVWEVLSAIVQVIAGILVVAFPWKAKLALSLILAAYLVAEGVLKIIRARQHRTMRSSGWLTLDGLLSLALGILILVRWPTLGVWALGFMVGISLVVGGSSMVLIGLGSRSAASARS